MNFITKIIRRYRQRKQINAICKTWANILNKQRAAEDDFFWNELNK